jgi:hypothetical protein
MFNATTEVADIFSVEATARRREDMYGPVNVESDVLESTRVTSTPTDGWTVGNRKGCLVGCEDGDLLGARSGCADG